MPAVITGENHRIGNNATMDSKSPISNWSSAVPGNSTHYQVLWPTGSLFLQYFNIFFFTFLRLLPCSNTLFQASIISHPKQNNSQVTHFPTSFFSSFSPFPRLKSDYSPSLIELHQLLSMRQKKIKKKSVTCITSLSQTIFPLHFLCFNYPLITQVYNASHPDSSCGFLGLLKPSTINWVT